MLAATGYFTIESNLLNRDTTDIETVLGFRKGRFDAGVRFLELLQRPTLDQFELGGSTRYSDREGLVMQALTPGRIPMAWTNQRLVKVEPLMRHTPGEKYPAAKGFNAAEQWWLKPGVQIPAREICTLRKGETYWGRAR